MQQFICIEVFPDKERKSVKDINEELIATQRSH